MCHEMHNYVVKIQTMEYNEYCAERMSLFSLINGDLFYKLSCWPQHIIRPFLKNHKVTMIRLLFSCLCWVCSFIFSVNANI